MPIKRYVANADNTITNAFKSNLTTRGTGSNMGASDILEVFSIYGQTSSSVGYSTEESRALLNFPISTISSDRTSNYIPASGSVSFYLKLYNAIHATTTPDQFTLVVAPVSRSWTEGSGLDMDEYTDLGFSNWISASSTAGWVAQGGDFLTGSGASTGSQFFDLGTEDLEVDVTTQVERWIAGTTSSNGFGIFLTQSQAADTRSYYTKKFFGRDSEYKLWRPHIEARWNSQIADDRGNFVVSSSLLSTENLNTIYLYNLRNNRPVNIPTIGTGNLYVKVYETLGGSAITLPLGGGVVSGNPTVVTGGWVSTGVYSASFAYTGTASTIYDVWQSSSTIFHTGTIYPETYAATGYSGYNNFVLNIKNVQTQYYINDKPKFRLYVREKDWNPTIYTVASTEIESSIIEKAYYRLFRVQDSFEVVPYGTGSTEHTLLSFDVSGNYFDFDMSLLEKGYMYGFKFAFDLEQNGQLQEQPYVFKFRVEE